MRKNIQKRNDFVILLPAVYNHIYAPSIPAKSDSIWQYLCVCQAFPWQKFTHSHRSAALSYISSFVPLEPPLFLIHPFAGLTVLLPSIPSISSPGKCGRDADSLLSSGPRRILRMLGSPLHGSSLSGIRKSSSSARYAFRPVSSVSVRPPGPCGDSPKIAVSSAILRPTAGSWPHSFLQSRQSISGET